MSEVDQPNRKELRDDQEITIKVFKCIYCGNCTTVTTAGNPCMCAHCGRPQETNQVNHPSHYKPGAFECIDVIEDWKLNFHLGNAVKYICRAGRKSDNPIDDLEKAAWYLRREIDRLDKGALLV